MGYTGAKLKQMSGLLLVTGLSLSMIILAGLSFVGVIPYPGGLLSILGYWLGIVLLVLVVKAVFRRPSSPKPSSSQYSQSLPSRS